MLQQLPLKQAGHMSANCYACSGVCASTFLTVVVLKAQTLVSKQELKVDRTCMKEMHGWESFSGKCWMSPHRMRAQVSSLLPTSKGPLPAGQHGAERQQRAKPRGQRPALNPDFDRAVSMDPLTPLQADVERQEGQMAAHRIHV